MAVLFFFLMAFFVSMFVEELQHVLIIYQTLLTSSVIQKDIKIYLLAHEVALGGVVLVFSLVVKQSYCSK